LLLAAATIAPALAGIVGPNESVTRAEPGASTKDPAGMPVNGLAVSLMTTTPAVSVGLPIRINIEVRNVSSVTQFLAMPLSPCYYVVSLTDVSTGAKSDIGPSGCDVYSAGPWTLETGKSMFLDFRISDYTKIPIGTYHVRIEALWRYWNEDVAPERMLIASNTVSITVTP
jgi:hypothetical protein